MKRVFWLAVLLAGFAPTAAFAYTDYWLGEIVTTAGAYCPPHTLPADGRLLQIKDYAALYSIIEHRFGGNGRDTMGLPKLNDGSAPTYGGKLLSCVVVTGLYPSRP